MWRMKKMVKDVLLTMQEHACQEVLVLGDSHAAIFQTLRVRAAFPARFFNVVAVGGATVSGLENPNSKTNALTIFRRNIRRSKARTVITLLGEVDVGFVIWYKAEKHNASVSDMLTAATDNYKRFLQSLVPGHAVLCISVPLPTIKDGRTEGIVANARRDVQASQVDRTQLTIRFNKSMEHFCQGCGITYLDLDVSSMGDDGLVAGTLLNADPTDHHYDPRAYARMLTKHLRVAFASMEAQHTSSLLGSEQRS